ncbi:hypothetical protein OROGR_007502 [Orobanche gracilis]
MVHCLSWLKSFWRMGGHLTWKVSKAAYIEGVEESLIDLKKNGYEMHTWTNYAIWFV